MTEELDLRKTAQDLYTARLVVKPKIKKVEIDEKHYETMFMEGF